nr:uncharacterized protein LOC110379419 isoform X2 [Helicoverpa armigera]
MDTKSLHSKHPKKMKPSKDKQEVFVLTPDILKKLGINIDNADSSQIIPPDVNTNSFSNSEISSAENVPASTYSPKPSDTSILETASLMMKSVFLSPTFIPTVANVTAGEVELLSNNNIEETFMATDSVEPQAPILIPEVNNKGAGFPDSSDILEQCYTAGLDQYNTTLNGEHISVSKTDEGYLDKHVDGNKIQEDNTMTLNEIPSDMGNSIDNVDGVYNEDLLKDLCNKELIATGRNSPYISSNDVDMRNPAPKPAPKINIVSEETIALSELRKLKSTQFSNKNTLTPVTINSIVYTKMNNAYRENLNNKQLNNYEISHSKKLGSEEKGIDTEKEVIGIGGNSPPQKESCDKVSKISNEIIVTEVLPDCQMNGHDSYAEDNTPANLKLVNDLDINGDALVIDRNSKTTEICNGRIDDEVASNKKEILPGIECRCDNNNEGKSDKQEETVIEKTKTDSVNLNTEMKSNRKESSNLKQSFDEDCSVKNKSTQIKENKLASMLIETKNLSDSNADKKIDKVKEIAAYLRKFSHIYTDKKKTKMALKNDVMRKEAINSNINMTESKLCIQGVEKPGGTNFDSERTSDCKVMKTYTRRNLVKTTKPHTSIIRKTETIIVDDAQEYTLHAVNILTPNQTQQFCLCFDFGHLSYYDNDNLYEHIHFWRHNTANCDMDVIFSIYNDEIEVKNETLVDTEEKTDENDETYNVCCNIYSKEYSNHLDNCDNDAVPSLEPEHITHDSRHADAVDTPQVSVLNNESPKANSPKSFSPKANSPKAISPKANSPKEIDQAQSTTNLNVDDVIEVMDEGVVDKEELDKCVNIKDSDKSSNAECNERVEVATATASESDCINPSKSTSRLNSTSDCAVETSEATMASDVHTKKRKLSSSISITSGEPSLKKKIKCGVCNGIFSAAEWESHVETQHDLIAWKAGTTLNLDDPELKKKLKEKIKSVGLLKCSLCNMEFKKLNRFIEHVKYCIQNKGNQKPEKPARKSRIVADEKVTCGVCQKTLLSSNWLEHSGTSHNYLAWIDGQDTLNVENESDVRQHLQNIIRINGKLTCYKCGLSRSRVKLYLAHVKTCDGTGISLDDTSTTIELDCSSIQNETVEESTATTNVKCGVCQNEVARTEWLDHIAKEHTYLAWREGETPLNVDDEELVCEYLKQLIRQYGGLTCHKCGLVRKRGKLYLAHVETCDGIGQADISLANTTLNTTLNTTTQSTDVWIEVPVEGEERKVVKCGVCSQEVPIVDWIKHIGKEHDYLAWRDGSTPLDLEDELAVKSHLLDVSRQAGGLMCNKCEKIIKYPKVYVQHIKECNTGPLDSSKLDTSSSSRIDSYSQNKVKDEILTCGVCASKVESALWIKHIEKNHHYISWVDGETPIDKEDSAMVQKHLYDLSKILGGLVCTSCGLKRKYVKSYLDHIEVCDKRYSNDDTVYSEHEIVECARCAEKVPQKAFRKHAMKEHYNIAWAVGDNPIDLNNPYVVESYLKEYHHANNKLVCKVCRKSRVSYVGFYAHIIACGKTEEETDMYKNVCDLCNNKYLIIYKSQHMTMHREKEYALERKQLALKEEEMKKEEPLEVTPTGRRRAAERAKTVIEKYKNCLDDGSYHCSKCGFNSEIESELTDHVCVENKWVDASDSDDSVKLENCSDEESEESDVDSNVSDEEHLEREETPIRKKFSPDSSYKESTKVSRIPYQIKDISKYMKRSAEEFFKTYLTEEELFTQWRHCEIEEVSGTELVNCMPPVEESCKVRFDETDDWKTFKRLEAERLKDRVVMFLGASIQCMRWAPATSAAVSHYLAVATHREADTPRVGADVTHSGPGLLQIWDCGDVVRDKPRFALGLVHDYGTIWSIDWCPSGARDADDVTSEPNRMHRLGLLAVACSNGAAYIFAVPYPSSITEKENPFYKLKPIVELRLASNVNRKVYQATAVKWSMQKGHSHVVVGYADGTTAYYDLNGDSPLLRTTDNSMTVFYPYHDERVLNSCIEDVDIYPSGAGFLRAGGAVVAGSAGGAGAGALQSHVPAARVLHPPHWPAAMLAGDDCLVNQSVNELEWWGGGRRLGGSRCAAGCAWSGRVAAAAPPLLRLLRLHPCYPDVHKQVIGLIEMIPLGTKRKRQNDELSMIVEPTTYSESVKKYGIEYKQLAIKNRKIQQKLSATPRDAYPERYPLSDVTALQFCHTFELQHKLAVAMHAGLIFIVNV